MKKALTIALTVVFVLSLAAPAFAMTHSAEYEWDGSAETFERQVGHWCNTGAEQKVQIAGEGQMSRSSDITMSAGKLTVDKDLSEFVTAEDATDNLTVTSVIELCAPPKTEYTTTHYIPVEHEEVTEETDDPEKLRELLEDDNVNNVIFTGNDEEFYGDYDTFTADLEVSGDNNTLENFTLIGDLEVSGNENNTESISVESSSPGGNIVVSGTNNMFLSVNCDGNITVTNNGSATFSGQGTTGGNVYISGNESKAVILNGVIVTGNVEISDGGNATIENKKNIKGDIIDMTGGDTTPPELDKDSIKVSPDPVEVGDEVTFEATVTDDMSGVYSVQADYDSPSGSTSKSFWKPNIEEGQLSVTVEETIEIKDYTEDGTWELNYVYVSDHAGNVHYYERNDFDNPEEYDFTVNNPDGGDTTPPEIDKDSIKVSPDPVEVGDEVTFEATVTDDMSGVYSVQADYDSPSGSTSKSFWKPNIEEGQLSVTVEETIEIKDYTEDGTWELKYIHVRDHAGNVHHYERNDFDNPEEYDFTVNNPDGGDTTPPEIDKDSIKVSPDSVEVGDEVTFEATVTDDMSGVYGVHVDYDSPSSYSTRAFRSQTIGVEEGQLYVNIKETMEIYDYTEGGNWRFNQIFLTDFAGNRKHYERNDFENPEELDFTVINPN